MGLLADITARSNHVRFTPDIGHSSVQVSDPVASEASNSIQDSLGFLISLSNSILTRPTESNTKYGLEYGLDWRPSDENEPA
jgi:hypothetical protein